ncbi:MAG TPA: NAD(P)H-hydrate dehydratase, partial [Burkholderiales bacterium]
ASPAGTAPLMRRAGLAAADVACDRLLAGNRTSVLVLAGPGNNGGDALWVACHLKDRWFKVEVVFTGRPEKLSPEAREALDAWRACGGELLADIPAHGRWDAVVDGLFGIGLARDLEDRHLAQVDRVNALGLPVLAIDVPSGLCSDTGRVRGAAVRATLTVTFVALKPGQLTHAGTEHCGEILLRELGVDAPGLLQPRMRVLDRESAAAALAPRPADSHKGSFGSVGILGGAQGMTGAAYLAGRAALKLGSGRVYLGMLSERHPSVDIAQPELMVRAAAEIMALEHLSCLAVGPGMGHMRGASRALDAALKSRLPLVLDADALNLLAANSRMQRALRKRAAPIILTPHPAEAGRLLGSDTDAVQNDRVAAAAELAKRYNALVVLKGAGSICAAPGGIIWINTTGNPGLASAGQGDVLSGMIAAFLAQGLDPADALHLGVFLHGAAADALVERGVGPVGMTASEVTDAARELLNRWVYGEAVKA